jgi:ribosomal protein L11 methyltransferase
LGKAWPALDIHVPSCDPQLQELVLAELDDFHLTAIHEAIDAGPMRAFFVSAGDRDAAARALLSAFASHIVVESRDIDDEDWAAKSQASLKAVTIGRITVAPPWDTPTLTSFSADKRVIIQPSMGFGTGHHATTRLMLQALQQLDVVGRTVLDVGCGSGVLAIASVLLGARSAVAVDNDPDALGSAAENVALNDVADRVTLAADDLRELHTTADIVLANLMGALLENYAEVLAKLVAPKGSLIVSGFMDSEARVVPALGAFLALDDVVREEEWQCARLSRPAFGALTDLP